jgi:hypothetical protein
MTTANDEFSLHPLHIFSSSQYSNFVLGKTLERVFRSFSSVNSAKFQKTCSKVVFKAKKICKTRSELFNQEQNRNIGEGKRIPGGEDNFPNL